VDKTGYAIRAFPAATVVVLPNLTGATTSIAFVNVGGGFRAQVDMFFSLVIK
jgi:hypothetical protein